MKEHNPHVETVEMVAADDVTTVVEKDADAANWVPEPVAMVAADDVTTVVEHDADAAARMLEPVAMVAADNETTVVEKDAEEAACVLCCMHKNVDIESQVTVMDDEDDVGVGLPIYQGFDIELTGASSTLTETSNDLPETYRLDDLLADMVTISDENVDGLSESTELDRIVGVLTDMVSNPLRFDEEIPLNPPGIRPEEEATDSRSMLDETLKDFERKKTVTQSDRKKRIMKQRALPTRATKTKKLLSIPQVKRNVLKEDSTEEEEFESGKEDSTDEEEFESGKSPADEIQHNHHRLPEVLGDDTEEEEDPPARDPNVHILDAITDWTMGRIQSHDSAINGGDGTQYLEDAFVEYVDKALVESDPPQQTVREQMQDFEAIEEKIKRWQQVDMKNLTTKKAKLKLWEGIENQKTFLKEAKQIFQENITVFKARFLTSTITTLMGISYVRNNDPNRGTDDPTHQWIGKFMYKDKNDQTRVITELIP